MGGGNVVTSGWLLEVGTSEMEKQEAQRRVRGAMSRIMGGQPLEPHLAAHLCVTQ